jgi:hypothetical protein
MCDNSKYLFFKSTDITNGYITTYDPLEGNYQLISLSLTNNIFNINSTNNKIYINENSVDLISTLTEGYYTISNFLTHLSTQLNASCSGTITITLNENTNKITITNSTYNFYLTFGTNTTNSARILLGFNATDGTNAISQTSNNPIDLNTNKYIFMKIEQSHNRVGVLFPSNDYFNTSLFLDKFNDTNFGEVYYYNKYNNNHQNQTLHFKNPTKRISISFHDIDNNTINLNESVWYFVIKKND